jgi:hypothetical protein
MKTLICALTASAIAGLAPNVASAADLGGYDEQETVVERSAPIVEHERIVERRYYEPDDDYYYEDAPVVTYYRRPHLGPYPYYAAYPYRVGPYYHHRYWRRHARW